MPSKQYLAKIEARRRADHERQRRRLYTALRKGDIAPSPMTHTVQFMNGLVTISEPEYLWLKVRGHLMETYHGTPIVIDTHYLHIREAPA